MAMLAEPRRKIRYTVNPTGQDWARSDSGDGSGGGSGQFGQRMLKSMGWREGEGLGKDGQGAPEPIRVKRKNDQRGVGCTGAYAAESMPQSVDFASLLSQLNEAHSTGGGDVACCHGNHGSNAAVVVSLEAKSRSSRARLHYHRFTRGKDVSAYDSQSLACIFGSRGAGVKEDQASASAATAAAAEAAACDTVGFGFAATAASEMKQSRSEGCLTSASQEEQQEQQEQQQQHGLQLVQSQTSLHDYFRAKMQARMLARPPVVEAARESVVEEEEEAAGSSWTSESSCSAASTLSEPACDEALAEAEAAAVPKSKKVRFSVSPERLAQPPVVAPAADRQDRQDDHENIVVIDFTQFSGSHWQRVLGYPLY